MKKFIKIPLIILVISSIGTSVFAYSDTSNSLFIDSINELSELKIINGFEDGTFRPENNLTRAEASKLLSICMGFTDENYQNTARPSQFSDYDQNHWAYKYVDFLTGVNVIDGFEDGTFRPEENVTFAQFIKMAVACLGKDGYVVEAEENSGYPSGYIETAKKYGFISEMDISDFNSFINREQASKVLDNTINMPLKDIVSLTVIDENHNMEVQKIPVTNDGTKKNFPLKTLKDMILSGDRTNTGYYTEESPIDVSDAFYTYCTIEKISDEEYTINPDFALFNTDGSMYHTEEPFTAVNDTFTELDENEKYYMRFEKQDGKWYLSNYAVNENNTWE